MFRQVSVESKRSLKADRRDVAAHGEAEGMNAANRKGPFHTEASRCVAVEEYRSEPVNSLRIMLLLFVGGVGLTDMNVCYQLIKPLAGSIGGRFCFFAS